MPIPAAKHQVQFPTLNQENSGEDPRYVPTGGFYTEFPKLNIKEPARTFNANMQMAMRRANRTVPQDAMTKDIHSYYWERV